MNCSKEESWAIVEKNWEKMWEHIKSIDLPDTFEHPISETSLRNEYISLCTKELTDKANSKLIHHFFPSIMTANKQGCLSPVEYWKKIQNDPEEFKAFYENRLRCSDWFNERNGANRHYLEEGYVPDFIFAIGLSSSAKAPRVSYFKPAMIKNLINKYASEFTTIFDPFTGYGKFIGALAAGKKYIGCDINDVTVRENLLALQWMVSNFPECDGKVGIYCQDAFEHTGTFECIITCPPYSDEKGKQIEEWMSSNGKVSCSYSCDEIIDKVMRNYDCKRYIFIVDDSMLKYREYIKEKHENVNYINARAGKITDASRNYEAIVVIEKEERDGLIK